MPSFDDVGAALSALSSAVNVANHSIRGYQAAAAMQRGRKTTSATSDALLKLLKLGPSTARTFRISTDHPALPTGELPRADLEALAAIIDPNLAKLVVELGAFDEHDDVTLDVGADIVLIGSPESEPLTRLIFGYAALPGNQGVRYLGGTIPLAYRWDEERSNTDEADCRYNGPDGSIVIRPNWPLYSMLPTELPIYPSLIDGINLETDYLIITKIPNFLTDLAWQRGRTIVSIAGLHGIGTRAIGLLLQNSAVMNTVMTQIDELPQKNQSFQIVIKITEIDHSSADGSEPRAVAFHAVAPLALSKRQIRQAQDTITERYSQWLTTVHRPPQTPPVMNRLGSILTRPFTPEQQAYLNAVTFR